MKYFITGATGYIGTQLTKRLVAEGNTVHALYRSESKIGELRGLPNVFLKKGDLLDKPSLEAAVAGCDAVFHVAAFAKPWDKDPRTFYEYNFDGAVNVFEVAQKAGVRRIVFTSTAGTMNPSLPGKPSFEDNPRTMDYFTDYDRSKGQAEEAAKQMSGNAMDIVTVNPSRVYGPGLLSDSNGVTRMVRMYLDGKFRLLPGDGNSIGNYVFIDDVVEGHLLAMQKGRGGERYIIGGANASFNVFFEILTALSGKKQGMIKVPLPVMNIVGHLMEWRAKLTGTPPILTPPWVKRFHYNWELSVDKAKRELGYAPLGLEQGLMKTVRWLTTNL
ncbi:MAG: NAD-dependent epimerase/dehydratase family protein [Saprospiraceae bacterium]|nr:NAD-dependent epimerase/dehydratase family protein [Saprospiraceae bacterium]